MLYELAEGLLLVFEAPNFTMTTLTYTVSGRQVKETGDTPPLYA